MILPPDFINYTKAMLGNEWDSFLNSLSSESPVSIRFNNKTTVKEHFEQVKWCSHGVYLSKRPSFTLDPLFHAGCYYVQEASSMFLEQVVRQLIETPVTALDLCAAPGGKSTHLSQILPNGSLLISNEFVRSRAFVLTENIQKWGNANNIVSNNAPKDFSTFNGMFDFILIDAPCSGEGMFRKDSDAIGEWSRKNVDMCAKRQKEIVQQVWNSLKENGLLVYSTCTYNQEENEKNVDWITKDFNAEILHLRIENTWGIIENDYGYRFFPHKTKGEGFFISVLRKKEPCNQLKIKQKPSQKAKIDLNDILQEKELFEVIQNNSFYYAVPKNHIEQILFLQKQLNVIHMGIPLYEQKGKDLIPQAGLALSKYFTRTSFPTCNLNYSNAIAFLQKEAIWCDAPTKGFVAVCYNDIPLGWVKHLGNRCNNLYPAEWRIRSKNIQREALCLLDI